MGKRKNYEDELTPGEASGIESRLGVEDHMPSMLGLIVGIAERLDGGRQ